MKKCAKLRYKAENWFLQKGIENTRPDENANEKEAYFETGEEELAAEIGWMLKSRPSTKRPTETSAIVHENNSPKESQQQKTTIKVPVVPSIMVSNVANYK